MTDYSREAKSAYPEYNGDQRDYKAWAKRIMFREENHDTNLLPIQVQFAREALGIAPPKKEQ